MSMPEFVILQGIEKAWQFLRENLDFSLGYLMRELPSTRQEEYRKLLRDDNVSIVMGYPQQPSRSTCFAVVLQSESEAPQGQFVGDAGVSNRALPYPVLNNDIDYTENFYGVTYEQVERGQIATIGGHIDTGTDEVRLFPPRYVMPDLGGNDATAQGLGAGNTLPLRKNQWQQRESGTTGDEQYGRVGEVQKLYGRDAQRLFSTVVGDTVNVGIIISTDNAEKTLVYYRLLRWVLRRFTTWFNVNGVLNPTYSGTELSFAEGSSPTLGLAVFQRTLNISFQHNDVSLEVEPVLFGFMLEIDMLTQRQDGGYDVLALKFDDE